MYKLSGSYPYCVSYRELVCGDEPIINRNTLYSLLRRNKIIYYKHGGGKDNEAMYIFESIPEQYKKKYMTKKANEAKKSAEPLVTDPKAREFYVKYKYNLQGIETTLSDELINEYTLNAQVLNTLIKEHNDRKSLSAALNHYRKDLQSILQESSEKMRETYGHTLPSNTRKLMEKIREYRQLGYEALISKKNGNTNTLKINEESLELLISLKRSRVPIYTNSQLFVKYNQIAIERGWKPLKSQKTINNVLNRPDVKPMWLDAVVGERRASQLLDRNHKTILPKKRDLLWYGDGTRLNLYYRDDKGKVATIMVYEVIDAYSEVLLGYHISEDEDYIAQYNAYRMAIQVSGHRPYEIVHDNQGGHKKANSTNLFAKICHIHRTTAPYNPESKTIERVFGMFQAQVLHQDWRFTGQNVTSKKESSKPNLEFLEANKHRLFTLQQLKERYVEMREMWNGTRAMDTTGQILTHYTTGKPRIQMYLESENNFAPEISAEEMVDMFWLMTKAPSTFTNDGIEIKINQKKYRYEVFSSPGVPDHEWRNCNTYRQFFVKYDPYDMTSVRLYRQDKSGALRFERVAEPYMEIHRAIQEQDADEAKFIRQEQNAILRNRIERQVKAKDIEWKYGVAPEQNGLYTPSLKGVTADVQREIDRRTKKYSRPPEELSIGRATKKISLSTFDLYGEKKLAGKL
jgi:hypothetical protein